MTAWIYGQKLKLTLILSAIDNKRVYKQLITNKSTYVRPAQTLPHKLDRHGTQKNQSRPGLPDPRAKVIREMHWVVRVAHNGFHPEGKDVPDKLPFEFQSGD